MRTGEFKAEEVFRTIKKQRIEREGVACKFRLTHKRRCWMKRYKLRKGVVRKSWDGRFRKKVRIRFIARAF